MASKDNPRKGKVLYSLWITREEEELLNRHLESGSMLVIGDLIEKAKTRGDFSII